jgi:hypothetical protein
VGDTELLRTVLQLLGGNPSGCRSYGILVPSQSPVDLPVAERHRSSLYAKKAMQTATN